MKTISLQQPYASLVVLGLKQMETRSWQTKHTGNLLIHSSAGKKKVFRENYERWQDDGVFEGTPLEGVKFNDLPFGKILGRVNLKHCHKTELIFPERYAENWDPSVGIEISDREHLFGDYSPRRFGWWLDDPVKFKTPIPAKGQLSLWDFNEVDYCSQSVEQFMNFYPENSAEIWKDIANGRD